MKNKIVTTYAVSFLMVLLPGHCLSEEKAEVSTGVESMEGVDWDYPLYNAFYIGVDGTSVSGINEAGSARIQYFAYAQPLPNFHLWGDIAQTSAAELSKSSEECADTTVPEEESKCEIKSSIAASIGGFFPIWSSNKNAFVSENISSNGIIIGPSISYRIQKPEHLGDFAESYYAGLRFGVNKERYFSAEWGKSDGVPGKRIQFSGQLPIMEGRVVTGLTLNVGADRKARDEANLEADSIKIYVMTQVDFTKIFPTFSSSD